jgi:hypothetical protein
MTKEEILISINLGKCRHLPASFDKRFANNMAALAKSNPGKELTNSQREQLYRMLKSYRRQIPNTFMRFHPDNKATL